MYDSGSNISLMNHGFYKSRKIRKGISGGENIEGVSGTAKSKGIVSVLIKIFNIEKYFTFFIVKSRRFKDDLLLGLDVIQAFKLRQDENLKISQHFITSVEKKVYMNVHRKEEHTIKKLDNILLNYEESFALNKFDIGRTSNYEAAIRLTVNKYIAKKPYRCTVEDKIEIEKQIKELLEAGLIQESCSPYAAPVTLVYKKEDGRKSRLCVDFRELNKIVVPDSQPFPRIEDLTVRARGCKYYTKLDINSAFWSIPVREKDRYKMAFVTHHGHWQWTCLPFGLKSSPAIFQRVLSSVLRKNGLDAFAVNYIDDILIYSKTYVDHLSHVELTLKALKREGFKLNKAKCKFSQTTTAYLGHEIGDNLVRPITDNQVAINKFPRPLSKKQIRQFLGKVSFYLEYIPHYSVLLEPLYNLLRKNVDFHWTEECEASFNKVKNCLCSDPVLAIFNPDAPIYIYTDASIKGVGAILKQPQENQSLKPVFNFSRKLTEAQTRKKAIYLESLAIKEAILYWQYYLLGKKFVIFTDHKPLENFNIKHCKDPELVQILNYISQFNFVIVYHPGKDNLEADCFSRNPVLESDEYQVDSTVKLANFLTLEDVVNDQKRLTLDHKGFLENDVMYKRLNRRNKIWLTEAFGERLIKDVHLKQGHVGMKQLSLIIGQKFYFKNMYKYIKQICRSCDTCIKNKARIGCYKAPMSQLGPAKAPFEILSLDTIGGFTGNRSSKKYLHLIIDHFTRYAFIATSKTQMAKDFIKLLQFVEKKGKILTLLTDQYSGINSTQFKQFVKSKRINLIFTAVDCAFSNGLNERTNQSLVNRIRCKIYETRDCPWTVLAEQCVDEYNNTIHSSTGFTPKYLLTGVDNSIVPVELNKNNMENLDENRSIAFENSVRVHERNKKYYDLNVKNINYQEGDLVYVQHGNDLNRGKLEVIRSGPYKIKKVSNVIYVIDSGFRKKESNLFHASKLVPFLG